MRIQVCFICALFVVLEVNGFRLKPSPLSNPESSDNVEQIEFKQILDHFVDQTPKDSYYDYDSDYSQIKYWVQRAWSNDEFFESKDGPIFLMIQGEEPANERLLKKSAMHDLAKKFKAMMFLLEHRFYGKSQPTEDASTDNMQYLTADQALQDIKYFIKQTNKDNKYTNNNKWILFGGRYAGNLVAWSRVHFPNQVSGAISSSAPLEAKADYSEYNDNVRSSLNLLFPGCGDSVSQAIKDILKVFEDDDGDKKIMDTFKLCSDSFDSDSWKDKAKFFNTITSDIGDAVENNDEGGDFKIEDVCKKYILNNATGTLIERMAALVNRNKKPDSDCRSIAYQKDVDSYKATEWDSDMVADSTRQWMFQACNELGYFETSGSKDSLYSDTVPLRFLTQECLDVFGDKYNENYILNQIENVNKKFRGTNIKATNVVFLQGSLDPWRTLGMVKQPTVNDPLILINGTSNCADMNAADPKDPPALKSARDQIETNIKSWL